MVIKKQPFADWISAVEGESGTQFTLDQITDQNQVYLLDIPDYVEDLSEILAYDYQHIFESELVGIPTNLYGRKTEPGVCFCNGSMSNALA